MEQALKAMAAPIALAIKVLRMDIYLWVSWLLFCYGSTVKTIDCQPAEYAKSKAENIGFAVNGLFSGISGLPQARRL